MQHAPANGTPPSPSLVAAYLSAWRRTFDYTGVSGRREYWVFVLTHWIVLFPLHGFLSGAWFFEFNWVTEAIAASLLFLHAVPAFLASLSLTLRRVRDATGSGWFVLLVFVNALVIFGIALCPARDARRLAGLTNGYWDVWRKSADYLGVAKRGEFWPFTLINFVIVIGVIVFAVLLWASMAESTRAFADFDIGLIIALGAIVLVIIYALGIPWLPLIVRRVRDATGTGWVALVGLIPFALLPQLAVAIICMLPSREGTNTNVQDRQG